MRRAGSCPCLRGVEMRGPALALALPPPPRVCGDVYPRLPDPQGAAPAPAVAAKPPKKPVALDKSAWVEMPLIEREEINDNTRRFRFGLATPTTDLGLPVGQHIFIKGSVGGKSVVRAYTPLGHGPGYVDFVIKVSSPPHTHTHAHSRRSPTRTGPCAFNAAPAPVVETWRREGRPPLPLPRHLVCVEELTVPHRTSGLLSAAASLPRRRQADPPHGVPQAGRHAQVQGPARRVRLQSGGGQAGQAAHLLKDGRGQDALRAARPHRGRLGHHALPAGTLGPSRATSDTRGYSRIIACIAPCLQVATALLQTAQEVEIWLLYANQSPADILCQPELDKIAADPRMHIHYTVDRAGDDWKYSVGFINEAMCRDHLPPPGDSTFVFMCGPPPMLDRACKPNLSKLGHAEQRVHCF